MNLKKTITFVLIILALATACIYLFIPSQIMVSKTISAGANESGVFRFLITPANWQKWWPGTSTGDHGLQSGDFRFRTGKISYNRIDIGIENNGKTDSSFLQIVPIGKDSVGIIWKTGISAGNDPYTRISNYFKAVSLKKQLDTILNSLGHFIIKTKNIYGIDVQIEKVKVEFVVSAVKTIPHYPSTEEIYQLIGSVKNYIASQNAKEEDFPMLNVNTYDSLNYTLQVAIPADRQLPGNDVFSSKWLMKNGNILVSEVTGGTTRIDTAFKAMKQFVNDHQLTVMAIPFQSLVTNRQNEPDSGKWVTRIYYPVM